MYSHFFSFTQFWENCDFFGHQQIPHFYVSKNFLPPPPHTQTQLITTGHIMYLEFKVFSFQICTIVNYVDIANLIYFL